MESRSVSDSMTFKCHITVLLKFPFSIILLVTCDWPRLKESYTVTSRHQRHTCSFCYCCQLLLSAGQNDSTTVLCGTLAHNWLTTNYKRLNHLDLSHRSYRSLDAVIGNFPFWKNRFGYRSWVNLWAQSDHRPGLGLGPEPFGFGFGLSNRSASSVNQSCFVLLRRLLVRWTVQLVMMHYDDDRR